MRQQSASPPDGHIIRYKSIKLNNCVLPQIKSIFCTSKLPFLNLSYEMLCFSFYEKEEWSKGGRIRVDSQFSLLCPEKSA